MEHPALCHAAISDGDPDVSLSSSQPVHPEGGTLSSVFPLLGKHLLQTRRKQVVLRPDGVRGHHLQLPLPHLSPQTAFLRHWCQSRWSLCWLNCPHNVLDAVYMPARSFWSCLTPQPQPPGSCWVCEASGFFTGSLEEPPVNTPWEQLLTKERQEARRNRKRNCLPFCSLMECSRQDTVFPYGLPSVCQVASVVSNSL